ncbi:MAG: M23 family metallopeptidase [Verrucomicrobia bacterium]|jgi:murein DD-endopeptidase MepM/ murein hydrolase activator NlpD|nr:M23 family metallopeptidase [Verrucomicrobiota bacterium]
MIFRIVLARSFCRVGLINLAVGRVTPCAPFETSTQNHDAPGVPRPANAAGSSARIAAAIATWTVLLASAPQIPAQPFQLPTANHALFEPGGEEQFFAGTVGKPWTSGCFGCVRTEGRQMHEGLDIRCRQRDQRGEPTDPVMATADGTVAYLNTKPSLSNFGNYIVLRHAVGGLEIYSNYAHLRDLRPGLKAGQAVKAGETIATMGRTANTHEGISKDRAHVHFELNLFVNDRFPAWYKKTFPGQRNDHGVWNGQNLAGLDPQLVLLEQRKTGPKFDLVRFIQGRTELCRVVVRATDFPWLKRYPALIRSNARAAKEGIAGYEVALDFNAVPFELIPRAAAEIKGRAKFQLLSVNEAESRKNPCRRLVTQRGGRWELTSRGLNAVELLTY